MKGTGNVLVLCYCIVILCIVVLSFFLLSRMGEDEVVFSVESALEQTYEWSRVCRGSRDT